MVYDPMTDSNGHGFQESTLEEAIKAWQEHHFQCQLWKMAQRNRKEYYKQKRNATIVEPIEETVSE